MDALVRIVGTSLRIDEDALRKGVLIAEFEWPLKDKAVPLRVIYPDSYPRLRPIVRLRGDRSTFPKRHCSPIDGNLCLLGRDSRQWLPEWTVRDLLTEQLESSLTDTGEEDPQGEPAEYWWNLWGQRPSYCLIDSSWTLDGASRGTLRIRYCLHKNGRVPEVQAVVAEVKNAEGLVIHAWSGMLPAIFAEGAEVTIPWIYVDEPVLPDGKVESINVLMQGFNERPRHQTLSPTLVARWFAVLYKMEVGFQKYSVGWLFPFYFASSKRLFSAPRPGETPAFMVLPTYRAGDSDTGARAPSATILRNKKIAVIGLGAVGAPVALELARNKCGCLHLLDPDVVEPGNSIRWPLGASAWGRGKSARLARFIRSEYSHTEVKEYSHPIGAIDEDHIEMGDAQVLEAILSEVDLVVDGTASYGVTTTLSDLCVERKIPLVALYASPPVEGGVVVRFAPRSGCPTCLEIAWHSGAIERPPGFDGDRGLIQPPGCAERTFTGASFDLQELSLQTMRLILETLASPAEGHESVVQSLSFITNGKRSPPMWRVESLPKAGECWCARSA